MTILILFIFTLTDTKAFEIALNSPKNATLNNSFKVSISINEIGTYDIKIFIQKHTKEFSEIFYNGKWNSPFKYLKEAYPSQTEFQILPHFLGETQICVKARLSSSSKVAKKCNPITILKSSLASSKHSSDSSSNKTLTLSKNSYNPQNQLSKNQQIPKEFTKKHPYQKKLLIISLSTTLSALIFLYFLFTLDR